jgi:drug/metabolite transporter (DMT)-like permease
MSDSRFLDTHRTWEDWFGMALGVLIALSPWFPTQNGHQYTGGTPSTIIINTVAVGVLVFGLAQLEYVALQRWEEVAAIVLGLWLIVSPLFLGYSGDGMLRFIHTCLGGLVVLLAALQLWQDWDLSDGEMARHGQ